MVSCRVPTNQNTCQNLFNSTQMMLSSMNLKELLDQVIRIFDSTLIATGLSWEPWWWWLWQWLWGLCQWCIGWSWWHRCPLWSSNTSLTMLMIIMVKTSHLQLLNIMVKSHQLYHVYTSRFFYLVYKWGYYFQCRTL